MTALKLLVLPLALLAAPLVADAQDWRDPRSLRRLERGGTEVFWDGNCRVEQRLSRNGDLLERRSCRGDRNAYARAQRNGDADPPAQRYADEPEAPRYADDSPPRPQPGSVYRAPPQDEPRAAALEEPIPLAPHIVERAAPAMQAPRTPPRPPAPRAPVAAKVAPKAAVTPAVRAVAAKVAPKARSAPAAPRIAARAVPARPRKLARLAARRAPVSVRQLPAARPQAAQTAVLARVAMRGAPVTVPRTPPPVVAHAAPRPVAPAPLAAAAPRTSPPVETAVKKSGATRSEWLVVLRPEAAPAAAAAKPPADAKAEHALSQREYEAYIAKKRREPYSNL